MRYTLAGRRQNSSAMLICAYFFFLLAGLSIGSPALAQLNADGGGDRLSSEHWQGATAVDVQSGSFIYSVPDVSIGVGPAPAQLTLTRKLYRISQTGLNPNFANAEISSFGRGMEHNFESSVECNWQIYATCQQMTVHVNGQRYLFDGNKTSPTDIEPWGEYLAIGDYLTETADSYVFRSKAGFEADFPKSTGYTCDLYCSLASKWIWPNGETVNFAYEPAYTLQRDYQDPSSTPRYFSNLPVNRLTKVSNLHGNAIIFTYVNPPGGIVRDEHSLSAADYLRLTVKTISTNKDACVSSATTNCNAGNLESLTYTYSSDTCQSTPTQVFPVLTSIVHANGSQCLTRNAVL